MQQLVDKKVYDKQIMDDALRKLDWKRPLLNTTVNDDILIDKITVKGSEVDYTIWEYKF